MFLKIDKESKFKKFFFFFFFFWGGGGGGWVGGGGGGGSEHNVQMFLFYSSRNTEVPNYSEIHA